MKPSDFRKANLELGDSELALKYANPDGEIDVEARRQAGMQDRDLVCPSSFYAGFLAGAYWVQDSDKESK